jgi:hypothetical protein
MSAEPVFQPDRVIAALNEAGIDYVVVGGLAVAADGVVRATRDLDIVPDGDKPNMDQLARCLASLGDEHPIEGRLTGAALARPLSFKVTTKHGDVQIRNRIAPDAIAPVCSLAHLRAMKVTADRPRDRVDLAELSDLHGSS